MFTNLYDSSIESNFTPHMFISCLKESAVMNHKKCDFQQVIGWKGRMGHGLGHPVTVSTVHPKAFSEDFQKCYWKIAVFFPRNPRPLQYSLKIPGFSMIQSPWLFKHFSMSPNLNPCKLKILVKKNIRSNLPGLLMLCPGLSYATKKLVTNKIILTLSSFLSEISHLASSSRVIFLILTKLRKSENLDWVKTLILSMYRRNE